MAGYKTRAQIKFLNDLILSEEVYLEGKRVICTNPELISEMDTDIMTPRDIELTFESVMSRSYYTP
jgi:hypothetical protein